MEYFIKKQKRSGISLAIQDWGRNKLNKDCEGFWFVFKAR